MARTRGSYPNPVLDQSDDVLSTFQLEENYRVRSSIKELVVEFAILLDDPDIERYMAQGDIGLRVSWTCPATFEMSQLSPEIIQHHSERRSARVVIDQSRISGKVKFEVKLIALRDIPDYWLSAQNPDYGDDRFELRRGDLVGHAGSFNVDARKLYDPMRPPLASCFVFEDDPEDRDEGLRLYTSGDQVKVLLPKPTHNRFSMLKHRPDLQIATVMMPALMGALTELQQDDDSDDLGEYAWARSLTARINHLGIGDRPPFEQAQLILENPIDAVLSVESRSSEDEHVE